MNLADVRIGDRCWTGYCPTVDSKGQNATVRDVQDVLRVEFDSGMWAFLKPSVDVFWSRPEFPPKPKRMVKKEIKGTVEAWHLDHVNRLQRVTLRFKDALISPIGVYDSVTVTIEIPEESA